MKEESRYVLSVEFGKQQGRVYELTRDVVRIGRISEDNDIALGDPTVSRWHTQIIRLGDGTYGIEDTKSASGTFLNGELLGNYILRLQNGDRIQIGDVELTFLKQEE